MRSRFYTVECVPPESLDVWLAVGLLKRLGLDRFFEEIWTDRSAKIAWADVVSILVAARFCEPRSELHLAEHFYSQSALADLFGIPAYAIYDNRLYRALDKLLAHKARRGYSRDHRPDCKQVLIALVATREGLPLGYEVFEGNRRDSQTVETIVQKIEQLYGQADRIWIMDRGMGSAETLRLLGEENRRYILGTPKSLWNPDLSD